MYIIPDFMDTPYIKWNKTELGYLNILLIKFRVPMINIYTNKYNCILVKDLNSLFHFVRRYKKITLLLIIYFLPLV